MLKLQIINVQKEVQQRWDRIIILQVLNQLGMSDILKVKKTEVSKSIPVYQ